MHNLSNDISAKISVNFHKLGFYKLGSIVMCSGAMIIGIIITINRLIN